MYTCTYLLFIHYLICYCSLYFDSNFFLTLNQKISKPFGKIIFKICFCDVIVFHAYFQLFECVLSQMQSSRKYWEVKEYFLSQLAPLYMLMFLFSFSDANCEVLSNLFHSLDIWHKSIKLTAKISTVCTNFPAFHYNK